MSAWIQTVSGRKFPLLEIDPDAIVIDDIAHALSMLCRFNGQCQRFYSVAEHSVHVSYEIRSDLAMVGLMHDAAEAYLGDVPSPLKRELGDFKVIEDRLLGAIAAKCGFAMPEEATEEEGELKRADKQLLIDEKEAIMAPEPEAWPPGAPPVKDAGRVKGWPPEMAKVKFLERFRELAGKRTGRRAAG